MLGYPARTEGSRRATTSMSDRAGHLQCPFCEAYEVERLFLASLHVDSCACASCGARWDEDASSGDYRGRASHESVFEVGQGSGLGGRASSAGSKELASGSRPSGSAGTAEPPWPARPSSD